MEQRIRNPVLRFVVYGHVVLALGAAVQVWWIGEECFGEGSRSKAAAAFFATIACYGYNRLMRSRDASLREVGLFEWHRAHAKLIWAVVIAGASIALALIASGLPELIEKLWPVIIPAMMYVTPLRTSTGRVIGLRQVPGLKSLLVSWVWAGGTVLLAAEEVNSLAHFMTAVLFCFYLGIAIAFDARDALNDSMGLRTLPQLLGPLLARIIGVALLLPLATMLSLQYLWIAPGERSRLDLLPILGLLSCAIWIATATPARRWPHWLALDASIVLIPLLSMLGRLG